MATMGEPNLEATVLAALEVLYNQQQQQSQQLHAEFEHVQAADAYLRAFQVTPDAFTVAVSLLERGMAQCQQQQQAVVPVLFFASQTLANKLRRQHALPGDLSQWSFASWAMRLAQWLAAVPPTMPKMVPTQLVLALVACVPRIADADLAAASASRAPTLAPPSELGRQPSAIGFVLDLLMSLRVASTVLAEVLVVLAEELSDVQTRGVRERMLAELDVWAPRVLDELLPQLMQDAVQAGRAPAQEMVLRAARAWIRYARVGADGVVRNALVQSLLVFLRHDELFDAAVDLVVELVRRYADVVQDAVLIQWLVPQLMELRADFQRAAGDEDTDMCLGLCRIFTEMGESYMDLLVGDQQMNQTVIIDLLLDCMSYPDPEVADVTTSFWFRFLATLSDDGQRQSRAFHAQLLRLASICMRNLQFQADFVALPSDKRQDFKALRQDLGDILRQCCDVLGVDQLLAHCVQGLDAILQAAPQDQSWQAIEAHLYCVRSLGRNVERADVALVEPSMQLIFQHLPRLAQHPATQYTACLIVSRYALWLRDHPAFLAPLVEFLHQCIVGGAHDALAADWQVSSAAATALRSLAMDCWSSLGAEVLRFYLYVEQHDEMAAEDQVLVLEGICAGVARTGDRAAVLGVLEQVTASIVGRLTAVFNASANGHRVNSTVAMNELLRLLSIFDYLDGDDRSSSRRSRSSAPRDSPLVVLTERMWPAMNQILALFGGSDELVERVCRCYKRMLRACGAAFKPFLPSMVEHLVAFFRSTPKSSYLYAASMALKQFQDDASPDVLALLARMLHDLADATLPLFETADSMASHPDIVEEFFFLMERALRNVPSMLLASPSSSAPPSSASDGDVLLVKLLRCAVAALGLCHNDANKATLCFLEQTITRSLSSATPDIAGQRLAALAQQSFALRGGDLVDRLMRGVVLGALPRSRVDEDFGSIAGLMVQLAKLDGAALQQRVGEWFAAAQASHLVPFLSGAEVQGFQEDLFSATGEREFRRVLRHFARACSSRTDADAR
ncbi:hypothetical protein ATCC90586_004916 [Pythium insidiosum]|nr:hypothetical protein ATCC90586_004916 [Pythium insidiosum]